MKKNITDIESIINTGYSAKNVIIQFCVLRRFWLDEK